MEEFWANNGSLIAFVIAALVGGVCIASAILNFKWMYEPKERVRIYMIPFELMKKHLPKFIIRICYAIFGAVIIALAYYYIFAQDLFSR